MNANDPAHAKLAVIIQETEKMERMSSDMLDFSKPLILKRVRGNFDTLIRDSLAKLKEVARRNNIFIEYQSNPEVTGITFDSLRFEQVIVNLVRNAIEASPEGDTVTISTPFATPGNLILDVTDNGSGIPLAKRQQVFDPFFTTKKEGTGLGLPIVKKIVDAHGWSLQILDACNGGTTIRLNLKDNK